jgi:hypothetical protein
MIPVSFEVENSATHDNPALIKKNDLYSNYPNPFNPETSIRFSVAKNSLVNIEVFNIKGQKVRSLTNRMYDQGLHRVVWNGKDDKNQSVGSGIYFCKMKVNNHQIKTRKMMLIK